MKKTMKRILAVALSCVMVMLLLVGCGGEQQKFIGTWECDMDMTELMNKEFAQDEETGKYFKAEDFSILMIMTFNEDGTYSMSADDDSVKAAFESLKAMMKTGLEKYLTDMMAAQGVSMSIDEILALSGTTMDDMLEDALSEDTIDELIEDMVEEGNFAVKDGKLFLSDGKEHTVDENVYQTYEISGDTLTLLESFGEEDADEDDMAALYPLVFKKVK